MKGKLNIRKQTNTEEKEYDVQGCKYEPIRGFQYLPTDYQVCTSLHTIGKPIISSEAHPSHAIALFLAEHLIVLIDNGHSQQDAGAWTDSPQEVGRHSERSDAHTPKSGGGGDVTLEDLKRRDACERLPPP